MLPQSPYGIAKLGAYHLVRLYRNSYGLFAGNSICFNHEGPRRTINFVTRKITSSIARIVAGKQNKLVLGNLEAKRDWGLASDFVQGMWLILQQDEPDDFVLATGETHTVKEYLDETFKLAELDLDKHVAIDPKLYRPEEVPFLLGDYTKAKEKLGWQPRTLFKDLVKQMYEYEINVLTDK
jgi:GDPmannose 4,6-dehydratase